MTAITTRAGKGSPLTNAEVDSNFTNLDSDKLEKSGGTITGATVVSVSSAEAALRITQVGTGNALVVEDSANPDATPLLVSNDGVLTVGTASSTNDYRVDIAPQAGGAALRIRGGSGGTSFLQFADSSISAQWGFLETTSASHNINHSQVVRISTASTERLRINSSGNVGIWTATPTERLDVVGNIKASGTVTATTFVGALTGNADTATTATNLSGGTINATTGTFSGDVYTSAAIIEAGRGNGSVALTCNDGHGNANVAFNHRYGTPDVTGSSARIQTSVDSATAGMSFMLANSTTSGVAVGLASILTLSTTAATFTVPLSITGALTASSLAGGIATGTGASGTWGISVSGNAATVTNGVYQNQYGSFQTSFTNNVNANTNRNAGVYGSYAAAATNTPTGSGLLWNATSGTDGSGDGSQIWQDYVTNNLYARQRWGGTWGSWLTILSSNNYNSYAPTLTGLGASGTWGISVSGNAATATTATNLSGGSINATTGDFSGLIRAVGGTLQVGSSAGVYRQFRYDGTMSSDGTTFSAILNAANYNSYSPTLTGGGASGTWGISVTGNSATATALQTARTINGVSFNGTANITVADGTKLPLAGGVQMTGYFATVGNTAAFTGANDTTFSVRSSGTGTAASMSFHRPGAYAVNFGLDTDNVLKLGGWSAGGVPHYWDMGGTAYATAAMRAPIYYRIADTGYWYGFNDSLRAQTPSGYIDIGPKNSGTCHIYSDRPSFYFNQPLLYIGRRVLNEDEWINSKYFGSDGNVYANASSRAPIFYDQNDTGYYCDPNSRSRLNALKLNTNSWITDSLDFNRIYFTQGDGTSIRGYSGTWYIQMGSTSTTTSIIEGNGNFYTTGAVTAYWSDKRLKKNINRIDDWREILRKSNGYRFEWNDLGLKMMGDSADEERGVKVGILAQDAKEALPQAAVIQLMQYEKKENGVLIPKEGINYDPEDPYLTVQMEKYIPVLIEASKGLIEENDELKSAVAELLVRISALENQGN